MAVAIGAAIVSKPLWLVCVLGTIAAVGLYGMLAPLLRWWPWSHDEEEVTAEANADDSLGPWLDARSRDMQALAERLREQIASGAVVDVFRCEAIERGFWNTSDEVLARLHIDAPEWADYYMKNPDWYRLDGVTAIRPEEFEERAKLIDYTVNQIAYIRARL
jgi:hypothetical protein